MGIWRWAVGTYYNITMLLIVNFIRGRRIEAERKTVCRVDGGTVKVPRMPRYLHPTDLVPIHKPTILLWGIMRAQACSWVICNIRNTNVYHRVPWWMDMMIAAASIIRWRRWPYYYYNYTKHNVLERDAQRKMIQRLTDSICLWLGIVLDNGNDNDSITWFTWLASSSKFREYECMRSPLLITLHIIMC